MYEDPFRDTHLLRVAPGTPIPLPVLVQGVVGGLVDDEGLVEHAEGLFEALTARGDTAWHETNLLLIQYVLSRNSRYGEGAGSAAQYEAQHIWTPGHLSLNLMHKLISAYIRGGRIEATTLLLSAPRDAVQGTTRYLLCLAVANAGLSAERTQALFERLYPDAEVRR